MKEVDLYFYQQTDYRVNLEIKKVCSHNSEDKRAIENITMRLFDKNKLISEYKFTEGFWLPSSSKFVLKNKEKISSGCFKR
jgi:hypothetical protein